VVKALLKQHFPVPFIRVTNLSALFFSGFVSAAFENYRSGCCSVLERESRQLLNTCCTLAKAKLICYVLLRTYYEPSSSEGILIT